MVEEKQIIGEEEQEERNLCGIPHPRLCGGKVYHVSEDLIEERGLSPMPLRHLDKDLILDSPGIHPVQLYRWLEGTSGLWLPWLCSALQCGLSV